MACGTPVIASSRGSLPEVVGTAGFLVDAEDHATIAEQIVLFLMNPKLRAERREQSLCWAAQFTWERTARQMFQLYDDIAWRANPVPILDTASGVAAS
jgi:glycosyltransferase involved in cell wall biosynthesis